MSASNELVPAASLCTDDDRGGLLQQVDLSGAHAVLADPARARGAELGPIGRSATAPHGAASVGLRPAVRRDGTGLEAAAKDHSAGGDVRSLGPRGVRDHRGLAAGLLLTVRGKERSDE